MNVIYSQVHINEVQSIGFQYRETKKWKSGVILCLHILYSMQMQIHVSFLDTYSIKNINTVIIIIVIYYKYKINDGCVDTY